jgi:hypothetical protein
VEVVERKKEEKAENRGSVTRSKMEKEGRKDARFLCGPIK